MSDKRVVLNSIELLFKEKKEEIFLFYKSETFLLSDSKCCTFNANEILLVSYNGLDCAL